VKSRDAPDAAGLAAALKADRWMRRLIRMLLAGAAALGAAAGTAGQAEAAFTFAFRQQGADVVAIGNGSVDLAGLSPIGEQVLADSGVSAEKAIAGVAGAVAVYAGIAGPASFGAGGHFVASLGGGDAVAVNGSDGFLGVPLGYVSGSPLSSSMEFAGRTFASIGLSPGTYAWTWGSGIDADSFTVEIGPAVPEPASALSVGVGLIGLAAVRRRDKSRRKPSPFRR
jgi:PEP-CTERM motif